MILFIVIGIVSILLILVSKKFSDIPNYAIVVAILVSLLSFLIILPEREKDDRMKEEKYKGD